jgi:hypothetical protein
MRLPRFENWYFVCAAAAMRAGRSLVSNRALASSGHAGKATRMAQGLKNILTESRSRKERDAIKISFYSIWNRIFLVAEWHATRAKNVRHVHRRSWWMDGMLCAACCAAY